MRISERMITALMVGLFATAALGSTPSDAGQDKAADSQQSEHTQYVGLLEYTAVQNALGLDAAQKKQLAGIHKDLEDSLPNPDSLRDLPPHEREVALHAWETKAEKLKEKLGNVLTQEQLQRLQQIALQLRLKLRAGTILAEQSLAAELSLSSQQKEELADLHKQIQEKMANVHQALLKAGAAGGKITAEKAEQLRDSFRRLRDEAYNKAMGVLTSEQKQKLASMTGKIADINIDELLAEQSARVEKWTKRWQEKSRDSSTQQQTAPSAASGEQYPVGTKAEHPQAEQ